ncbi:MAG TPA: class I SAM-dependent methyltransferase [Gaiellaceae bacterium]|nr:class I SAM-dependent methyltransferase [Gaiellaceae bacterium]
MKNALDTGRAEAFGERMLGALNDAALVLMTSLGHRTGLFDTMARLPATTSNEIAEAAGLQERYVREWLGAMVVSRVVEYDPEAATYSLPAEHAVALTRAAGPDNFGAVAAYVPVLARVEDEVAECFRTGGGVPYSSYPRFQEVMAEDSATMVDAALIDTTLPLVPGLVDRLREGIDVADVGCGSGHALNVMAKEFPRSRFVGYDLSEEGLARAGREAEDLGLGNVSFVVRDLAALDEPGAYDLITAFDVVHDQAKPAEVLQAIARALAPEGTFLMVDFAASSALEENVDHPLGPTLYMFSVLHCMTVSLAQDGAGLGTVWGEQKAVEMLGEAGLGEIRVERVEGDPFSNYYIATR